jgi:hypothetical protein
VFGAYHYIYAVQCGGQDGTSWRTQPAWGPRYIASGRAQQITRLQQSIYCCYGQLPSDSSGIVDVFTHRYQATHVPSRDRCIATVLHATLFSKISPCQTDNAATCWTPFTGSPVCENKPNVCLGSDVSIRNSAAGNEKFDVDMSSTDRQKNKIYRSVS